MEELTAAELIECLHADENCELSRNIRTIARYIPEHMINLSVLYQIKSYKILLSSIREFARNVKEMYN